MNCSPVVRNSDSARSFGQAPEDDLQSLDHLYALPQKSIKEFQQFMHSVLLGVSQLQAEDIRALQSPISSVRDE